MSRIEFNVNSKALKKAKQKQFEKDIEEAEYSKWRNNVRLCLMNGLCPKCGGTEVKKFDSCSEFSDYIFECVKCNYKDVF